MEDLKKKVDFLGQQSLIMMDFVDVDESGLPPHYLKDLTVDERKNFVADMERFYYDERFNKVINYVINVLANYSFQKEPDEMKMRNGRYAVIGVRTLMKQFEEMHSEYLDSKKKEDDFDEFAVL